MVIQKTTGKSSFLPHFQFFSGFKFVQMNPTIWSTNFTHHPMKKRSHERVKILIVEDSPDDWSLTIHAVRRGNKNANIIHLWDGEELLDYLQKLIDRGDPSEDIKVIMLNIRLPKMGGFEVLKRLKKNPIT